MDKDLFLSQNLSPSLSLKLKLTTISRPASNFRKTYPENLFSRTYRISWFYLDGVFLWLLALLIISFSSLKRNKFIYKSINIHQFIFRFFVLFPHFTFLVSSQIYLRYLSICLFFFTINLCNINSHVLTISLNYQLIHEIILIIVIDGFFFLWNVCFFMRHMSICECENYVIWMIESRKTIGFIVNLFLGSG